ncbi:MAG TPA: tetratricopeptide repeat protein, partial [Blastocatellia bacterium]|nr:tetratricopeptide repeat protein [Blastocatellia bacterium]
MLILVLLLLHVDVVGAFQNQPGLIVEQVVPGSPAAKAGLEMGDRLLSYDDKPLNSPASLLAAQQNALGKKEVVLRIGRRTEVMTKMVPSGRLGIQMRPDLQPELLRTYEDGVAALRDQKFADAIARWKEAAEAARKFGNADSAAWLYGRIGESCETRRDWNKATSAHGEAWTLLKGSADSAARSAASMALGRCSLSSNDVVNAEKWFQEALLISTESRDDMGAGAALNNLGVVARIRGDLPAAQTYHTRALSIREKVAPNSSEVAVSLINLASVGLLRGEVVAARNYLSRAVSIQEQVAPDSLDLAAGLNHLGAVSFTQGDLDAADKYFSRAMALQQRLAPNSPELGGSLNNLGLVSRSRGDLKAAINYFQQALAIKERLLPGSLDVALTLDNLGLVARDQGEIERAQEYFSRALGIRERIAPQSLDVAGSLNNLGLVA